MNAPRCVLFVHAHPDDEASKGSATIAKLVAAGVRCVLVCCTGGEAGEVLNPNHHAVEDPDAMAELRRAELEASCAVLGVDALHWLGYRDSGMKDSDHNAHAGNFANAPEAEAVGRLVAVIRAERPQIVVGYAEDREFYAHPDHVRVHEITRLAFEAAGDPEQFPEAGAAWQPAKLYETGFTKRQIMAMAEAYDEAGGENPFRQWFEMWEASGLPDEDDRYRTQIEVGAYLDKRRASLLAHRTQIDPDGFWLQVSDDVIRAHYPYEDYKLVTAHVPIDASGIESDLFTGVPPTWPN